MKIDSSSMSIEFIKYNNKGSKEISIDLKVNRATRKIFVNIHKQMIDDEMKCSIDNLSATITQQWPSF